MFICESKELRRDKEADGRRLFQEEGLSRAPSAGYKKQVSKMTHVIAEQCKGMTREQHLLLTLLHPPSQSLHEWRVYCVQTLLLWHACIHSSGLAKALALPIRVSDINHHQEIMYACASSARDPFQHGLQQ